jgi:hypothetical protein
VSIGREAAPSNASNLLSPHEARHTDSDVSRPGSGQRLDGRPQPN